MGEILFLTYLLLLEQLFLFEPIQFLLTLLTLLQTEKYVFIRDFVFSLLIVARNPPQWPVDS